MIVPLNSLQDLLAAKQLVALGEGAIVTNKAGEKFFVNGNEQVAIAAKQVKDFP